MMSLLDFRSVDICTTRGVVRLKRAPFAEALHEWLRAVSELNALCDERRYNDAQRMQTLEFHFIHNN